MSGRKSPALSSFTTTAFIAFFYLAPANAASYSTGLNASRVSLLDMQKPVWHPNNWLLLSDTGPSDPDTRVWPKLEFTPRFVVATVLAFLAAALANGAGVGGGPLFVPLFNLFLGFDAKTSTALSKAMVFGGSTASLLFNIRLRHPLDPKKSIIEFGIASLLQPTLLLGISIGVTCNVMFPAWLLKLLLCTLLFFMANKTAQKGISTWMQEVRLAKAAQAGTGVQIVSGAGATQQEEETSVWDLIKWKYIIQLCSVWTVYFTVQLIKVKVPSCGIVFWILDISQVPASVLASFWAGRSLQRAFEAEDLQQPLIGGAGPVSSHWSVSTLSSAPLMSLIAGIVGGLLGIGGGVVMSPALLEFGIHPQVATATSSFMILFSSSMSVVEFYLLGRIPMETALFYCGVCFVAALIGLSVIRALVKWSNKASIVVFVLAMFMGLSAVVILVIGGEKSYSQWKAGDYMGFSSICNV